VPTAASSSALPAGFSATRESLRALACYAISPWCKARSGRIGLRSLADGWGTPVLDDGSRVVVRGDRLALVPGPEVSISTVRAAAELLGVEPSSDPGVGSDLPPYAPDAPLGVDRAASEALAAWYAAGQVVIDRVQEARAVQPVVVAQLWPEHFDLAVALPSASSAANVGVSPGDGFCDEPYVYVGPHRLDGLAGPYWNAPFGSYASRSELLGRGELVGAGVDFVLEGLQLLDQA